MNGLLIMKRRRVLLTGAKLILACNPLMGLGAEPDPVYFLSKAQDAASPAPTVAIDASPYIGGEGYTLLSPGEPDSLTVVAQGPYDGNILPIIVRNNTSESLYDVGALGIARDASGTLIATGEDQRFEPSTIEPGGLALGYVYLDGVELPSDATYEFELSAETPESGTPYFANVVIQEATFLSDRVVGIANNSNEFPVTGPVSIYLACLAADGSIGSFHTSFADKEAADTGEDIPFQVPLYNNEDCSTFVVALGAYG